jgi:HEAT repeat protein
MKSLIALFLPSVLLSAWLLNSPAAPPAADQTDDPDEQFLREAKLSTDTASLLAFLKKRSDHDDDLLHLDRLIRQLGDATPAKREEASQKLAAIGLAALPSLREALKNPDKEIARRAGTAIQEISKDTTWTLPGAAVRLLLRRQAPDTVEALLRYLPYVSTDEATEEDIWFGVYGLAKRDPRVLPLLTPALKDRLPARRALAACVMGRLGNGLQQELARKLLADIDAVVRLRAAQGLLAGTDKAGIPTLIALLNEPDAAVSWQAEELLQWIAGEDAPDEVVGACTAESRKKCRAAWTSWWEQHEKKIDLAKVIAEEPRRPGLMLVADELSVGGKVPKQLHRVWSGGCTGKPRWLLPLEEQKEAVSLVQLRPGNRVAIDATERDLQGRVLWHKQPFGTVLNGQRLPNGNVFVVTDRSVAEFTPDGEEVYALDPDTKFDSFSLGDVHNAASRTAGRLRIITDVRTRDVWEYKIFELDAAMRGVYRTVPLGLTAGEDFWNVAFQSDGRYLVTHTIRNEKTDRFEPTSVREYTAAGKQLKEWTIPPVGRGPGGWLAKGLPYGHILVDGTVEFDAQGKRVWEMATDLRNQRIRGFEPILGLLRVGFDQPCSPEFDVGGTANRVKELKSKNPLTRRHAAESLRELDPDKAAAAAPALMKALTDADRPTADAARAALYRLGPVVVPQAGNFLKHADPELRATGVSLLANNWPASKEYLPRILDLVKDDNSHVRVTVVSALGEMGRQAKQVIPPLIETLNDKDEVVRRQACLAIKRIGPDANAAIPALMERLKDKDDNVRWAAAEALATVGQNDKKTIRVLIQAFQQKEDHKMRVFAALALGSIGMAAEDAIPAFKDGLKDDDPAIRKLSAEALEKIQADKK